MAELIEEEDFCKVGKIMELLGRNFIEIEKESEESWAENKKRWDGITMLCYSWDTGIEEENEEGEKLNCEHCNRVFRGNIGLSTHWKMNYRGIKEKIKRIEEGEEVLGEEEEVPKLENTCLHKAAMKEHDGSTINQMVEQNRKCPFNCTRCTMPAEGGRCIRCRTR